MGRATGPWALSYIIPFVNLPARGLGRSTAFRAAPGFGRNADPGSGQAAAVWMDVEAAAAAGQGAKADGGGA